jgi:hypothetical protein
VRLRALPEPEPPPLSLLGRVCQVMERPQHMLMRVAVGIHKEDIDSAIETYNFMCVRCVTPPPVLSPLTSC